MELSSGMGVILTTLVVPSVSPGLRAERSVSKEELSCGRLCFSNCPSYNVVYITKLPVGKGGNLPP